MKAQLANATLAEVLDQHTVAGSLGWAEEDKLRCVACGHRCLIGDGKRGICKVRFNEGGTLRVPFGYVAGLQCDPVEKKPFFHVHPGSDALTFGMMGCDLHCAYCQNWVTSQALRDSAAVAPIRIVTPAQLVETAQRERARLVVSSYNEPLITAEWAVAVFQQAKAAGLDCAFVSNGNATPEVLDFLQLWIVAYKVDLKSFDDRHYRSLGGTLDNITTTIRMIHERGIWLEVVTLVIPGFNDSDAELRAMARFLASVSRDVPWHLTAFHQDYRMTDPDATPPATLLRAAAIGVDAGLRFVYAGNLPGRVGPWENTRCPGCGATLIERHGYLIRSYQLTGHGQCPHCATRLPGLWPRDPVSVRTGNDRAAFARRLPRAVAAEPSPVRGVQSLPLVDRTAAIVPSLRGAQTMATAAPTAPARALMPQRSALTGEQQHSLFTAGRDLVRSLALGGRTPELPLGALGQDLVAGAFVSLKRGKQLRSCCGSLGQLVPLAKALHDAAVRTVWEDVRFPPISPAELDYLDVEIWLLQSPHPVEARGAARAEAITIGKHGIQVVRGTQHALFLPSVALENQWDSQRFLDQCCVKAGLPPTAWRDDATALFLFEGEVVRGPVANGDALPRTSSVCQPDELRVLAGFCCDNIGAFLSGATPSHYCPGAPDGNVQGVLLTLQRPGPGGLANDTHFCQLSLRPGVPLQSTLYTLSQNAAQHLRAQPLQLDELPAMRVSVTLLTDAALHGTVAEHDLAGVDPRLRSVLVLERNKTGLVFDPDRDPAALLAEAANQARVTQPASAAVFSLATVARAPFTLAIVPQPLRGPEVRPPAVAGTFYPGTAAALEQIVDTLLAGERQPERWRAALVPHAGLVYSGRLAANVLQRLQLPRTVIVLGPKHTPLGMDWAVAPHTTWTFPGGQLAADVEFAQQLARAVPGLELDAAAHQREHAIEVELPLLARLAPQTRVVGIAIGNGDLASCCRFAAGLADVLRTCAEPPLLLISSDMNHFATDAETRRLDGLALAALERLDPAELFATVTQHQISMCGVLPAVIVLETLRLLGGPRRAERVGYATTADVTGDQSRVVGYAGMLLD